MREPWQNMVIMRLCADDVNGSTGVCEARELAVLRGPS